VLGGVLVGQSELVVVPEERPPLEEPVPVDPPVDDAPELLAPPVPLELAPAVAVLAPLLLAAPLEVTLDAPEVALVEPEVALPPPLHAQSAPSSPMQTRPRVIALLQDRIGLTSYGEPRPAPRCASEVPLSSTAMTIAHAPFIGGWKLKETVPMTLPALTRGATRSPLLRAFALLGLLATGGTGCSATSSPASVSGSSSGAAGSATGGSSTSGTSGSAAAGSTTTGTTSAGSGSTGSMAATTGGSGSACGSGLSWFGDVCAAVSCNAQRYGMTCSLGDGGFGGCYGGTCQTFDLYTDPNNCGGYGDACPVGSSCGGTECSGSCTASSGCPTGKDCVYGDFCFVASCGAGDDDQPCVGDAGPGVFLNCCRGACLDLQFNSDPQNCGGCGVACAAGQTCGGGLCHDVDVAASCAGVDNGAQCRLGSDGVGVCCLGSCADTANDTANCGGCNQQCPAPEMCQEGICSANTMTGSNDPLLGCDNAPCPAGTTCNTNAFFSSCVPDTCALDADGTVCLSPNGKPLTCCGGRCIDTGEDAANCGGCGLACPTGASCLRSCVFESCPGLVNGCSDSGYYFAQNCGMGLDPCPDGTACSRQQCLPTSCASGEGGACAFSDDIQGICCSGQCVNPSADSQNCQGCGIACPAGAVCISGTCFDTQPGSCACGAYSICSGTQCFAADSCDRSGGGDCAAEDGTVGLCCGNACAHPLTDSQNCGGCGVTCGAGQTCQQGLCTG